MTNTKRTHGYGESVVADLLKGLGTRLLTFEDEQAVFGKVQVCFALSGHTTHHHSSG